MRLGLSVGRAGYGYTRGQARATQGGPRPKNGDLGRKMAVDVSKPSETKNGQKGQTWRRDRIQIPVRRPTGEAAVQR